MEGKPGLIQLIQEANIGSYLTGYWSLKMHFISLIPLSLLQKHTLPIPEQASLCFYYEVKCGYVVLTVPGFT